MPWNPPTGVTPVDRKPPSAPTYDDIPAVLDWLRQSYAGHTVVGLLITDRATGNTYRVDAEPAYITPGTLSNYALRRVADGVSRRPNAALGTPEAVRLSSGAEVRGEAVDASQMMAPTGNWLGGSVPQGTAYAAEGASAVSRVTGLRVDSTVSNTPQAAFYGSQIADAVVKIRGKNLGTAASTYDVASAVTLVDATDVTVDLNVNGLGMKGASLTRVQGAKVTGRATDGNTGQAMFFQRLGSGVQMFNLYCRNGFGYKNDGGTDSTLIGGTFENSNVMLQGGKRNSVLGIKSIDAPGAALHAGYHSGNATALIDSTYAHATVYRSAGLNSVDPALVGLLVDAGGTGLEVSGLRVSHLEVDGGYYGIQQLSRAGGQLKEVDWSHLTLKNLTQPILASPLSGTIQNVTITNSTRGATITAQSGAPAGGVLVLKDWDVAQVGAATTDLALSVVSGVALDHLIIDGMRLSGGYRSISIAVGVDGSNAPLIKKITLRNVRATGNSSGTSVELLRKSSVKLTGWSETVWHAH